MSKVSTDIANTIDLAGIKIRYDSAVKKVLANRQILARILKACVKEFCDVSIDDIANNCIQGEVSISQEMVHRDVPPRVSDTGIEDNSINEGTVTFDIKFNAIAPTDTEWSELINLIINVEAQNDFSPGYPIIKRAVYYGGRMISAQYGTVFKNSEYDKLRKVYSIWVCTNPTAGWYNTISEYSMSKRDIAGINSEEVANYDLISVIMICLGNPENLSEKVDMGILRLLNILLSQTIDKTEKKHILNDEFGIEMTENINEEVENMCNLSEGVYRAGVEAGISQGFSQGVSQGFSQGVSKGISQGISQGIVIAAQNMISKMGMTFVQVMETLEINANEYDKYRELLETMSKK